MPSQIRQHASKTALFSSSCAMLMDMHWTDKGRQTKCNPKSRMHCGRSTTSTFATLPNLLNDWNSNTGWGGAAFQWLLVSWQGYCTVNLVRSPVEIVLHITYKPPPLMPKVLSDHDQLLILLFQRRSIFTHPVGKDIRRNWT